MPGQLHLVSIHKWIPKYHRNLFALTPARLKPILFPLIIEMEGSQMSMSSATQKGPIAVMVVDDHQIVREGLISLISNYDDMVVVGAAASGEEALDLAPRCLPDVILMDLGMAGIDGIEAARRILARCPMARIIALTSSLSRQDINTALEAGMIAYLDKDAHISMVADAIRRAFRNLPSISENTQAVLDRPTRTIDLSDRELEVLQEMAAGLTNRQIGAELGISTYTVNSHVRNILSKLNARSRAEAVTRAYQDGLLQHS